MSNFNFKSYVGGQLLMLTKAFGAASGKKNEIWRRGEIAAIREEGDVAVIEFAWTAIKRGGRYFLDDSSSEVAVPLGSARSSRSYSLVAFERSVELRLDMVYCFTEPDDNRNVPLSKVGEQRPIRRTSS
jgi:hypothetical protein